ncbi:MAG: S8 family serine peptidase [Dehalococcoidia bacterium]
MLKVAILVSVLVFGVLAAGSALSSRRDSAAPAVAGEVLVALDEASWAGQDLGHGLGGIVLDLIPEIRTVRLGLIGGEGVEAAIVRIGRLPGVQHVEPNLLLRDAGPVTDDTFYGGQASYLDLIDAPAAWSITTGDASVVVAVLDSGVDTMHPDLAGKIWTNPGEVAGNGIDDDDNGCIDDVSGCNFVTVATKDPSCADRIAGSVADDNGHGTFVAGIIGAVANNGTGITGAAPAVTVLPVKILDCLGGGSAADAAKGLLYAAKAGARVANISFTGNGESATLSSAIREAHDRYGMIIVAASGNDGTKGVTFPARLPEAISVGSSGTAESADARSPFSDWGPEVDVVAPGRNIVSTVPLQFCGEHWHCLNGEPYANASGTSFAAPLVSSLAALIVSKNPNLNPETVRWMILRSADALPDGDTPGWDGAGRIRMLNALEMRRYQIGAPGSIRE